MNRASVIIPVHNARVTVRKCVESLVFGKMRNLEILLIEDGSTDGSWEECARLSAEYENVRALRNDGNRGVSYSRNHGLEDASGEWILFVDSDDWVSGDYAAELLARPEEDAMPICGYHFLDMVHGRTADYVYTGTEEYLDRKSLFDLRDKILLQQLWNKAFRADVIRNHKLRFDEGMSMGEDTQFVLEYLEASGISRFRMIRRPLYYYVRANETSLMADFGKEEISAFDRLKKILTLAGEDDDAMRRRYEAAVVQEKNNCIYRFAHTEKNKKENLIYISSFHLAEKPEKTYARHKKTINRENAAVKLYTAKNIIKRTDDFRARKLRERDINYFSKRSTWKNISIISQNCIGGVISSDAGQPFLSPTVNLFIPEPGFVRMCANLKEYMAVPIEMSWDETYPIGHLKDVEIHFMHYVTCTEAREAWNRRKARINWDKIFVIGTDRDGFSEEQVPDWERIPYRKVLLACRDYGTENQMIFPKYRKDGCVPDMIQTREFYRAEKILKMLNEME